MCLLYKLGILYVLPDRFLPPSHLRLSPPRPPRPVPSTLGAIHRLSIEDSPLSTSCHPQTRYRASRWAVRSTRIWTLCLDSRLHPSTRPPSNVGLENATRRRRRRSASRLTKLSRRSEMNEKSNEEVDSRSSSWARARVVRLLSSFQGHPCGAVAPSCTFLRSIEFLLREFQIPSIDRMPRLWYPAVFSSRLG